MEHFSFHFEKPSVEQKDILIALLSENGFTGFEEQEDGLFAFIASHQFDEQAFQEIVAMTGIAFHQSIIEEKNWNEEWERDFQPVKVITDEENGHYILVRAQFHPADPHATHEIIITPRMSFGTGHHATTHLVLAQMKQIDFANKVVVDFGTGTCVLAILAEKLGATEIIALDNDDWSIRNAADNIEMNQCSHISLHQADRFQTFTERPIDIILANINLNVIKSNLPAIRKAAQKGTILLFSGILSSDEMEIREAIHSNGLAVTGVDERNNWLVVTALG